MALGEGGLANGGEASCSHWPSASRYQVVYQITARKLGGQCRWWSMTLLFVPSVFLLICSFYIYYFASFPSLLPYLSSPLVLCFAPSVFALPALPLAPSLWTSDARSFSSSSIRSFAPANFLSFARLLLPLLTLCHWSFHFIRHFHPLLLPSLEPTLHSTSRHTRPSRPHCTSVMISSGVLYCIG